MLAKSGWVDSAPMDNSQSASSTLDTLRTVEFRLGLKGYNVDEVDEYLDSHALGYNTLFGHLLQALIELAGPGSDERALLESISNHVKDRSGVLTNRLSWME